MNAILKGLAIGLCAATMAASGPASATGPSTPCTAANDGATETVSVNTHPGTDLLTYQCDATFGWYLIRRCSGSTGICIDY